MSLSEPDAKIVAGMVDTVDHRNVGTSRSFATSTAPARGDRLELKPQD